MPPGTRPTDLWHRQITMMVHDGDAAAQALYLQVLCLSQKGVALPDDSLGFVMGMLVRDPDGHALLLGTGAR